MSDMDFKRKSDGVNLYGYKILSGYEKQVKQFLLDTLIAGTDWGTAIRKIDDGAGKTIMKKLNTIVYDKSKNYNN